MLIEVLHPILVDSAELCESFRLNIVPEERKLRAKIQFGQKTAIGNRLVDLVVFNYSLPKIDGLGISVTFKGKEMETGLEFQASAGFKVSKRTWKVKGNIGGRMFSFECAEAIRIIEQIGQLIYPTITPAPIVTTSPNSLL